MVNSQPEYHGGVSGVLKNALDLMGFEQLDSKVTGIISVLGGQSNSNALNELLSMRWVRLGDSRTDCVGQPGKPSVPDGKILDENSPSVLINCSESSWQNFEV